MKNWFYYIILAIEVIAISLMDPITQSFDYHHFADQRTFLGIENFFDVVSNIPFLIIGLLGMSFTLKHYRRIPSANSWFMVFLGVFLVCPGSMSYHLNPSHQTLIWDRVPMTIGFMAITSALFTYHLSHKKELIFLSLSLFLGFFSIWYWVYFNDLRVYVFVQLTPILLIPIFAFTEPALKSVKSMLLGAFALYFLAKVTEKYDQAIFNNFLLSGHTIKHLLAGGAVLCFYKMSQKLRNQLRFS